ncbi:hypothetical protein Sste5346_003243 [Sporothrix stenoceras]|uniref:Carboxymuconolactone decarboxylase-like domain-containing protein n=1 Tax=Sporothrix stenoceras TaxID=5173 RepID=A0ABR3ZDW0_9PEZI
MRLPYMPNPPKFAESAYNAIVERVAARRAPRPLQPLDLALLHSPPVADGWNSFLGAIRTKTDSIPADLRELAVSRVAAVNRAWYEWGHHAPLATAAGVPDAGLKVVLEETPYKLDDTKAVDSGVLTAKQWAVLVYTDEMTRTVEVSDGTFAHLRTLFEEKQIVELTAVIAAYNCVSRFLVALDVGERNGTGPDAGH